MDNRHKQYIGDFLFDRELLLNNGGFYKLPLAWGSDDISATIAANTQIVTFQYRKNRFTLSSTGSIEVKVDALMKQRAWYIEFLSKEPVNLQDAKFRKRLLEICPSYFEKQVASKISMDVNNNIFHIIKWMKKKRKYGYSNRIFIYVLKSYIKNMLM